MNPGLLRAIGAFGLFLLIFVSGFWLSRSGKPYNGIIFNLHKLIALALVVIFALTLYRTPSLSLGEIIVAAAAGLFFLGLFISGGLASVEKSMPEIIVKIHHIFPYLAALSTVVILYLLSQPL